MIIKNTITITMLSIAVSSILYAQDLDTKLDVLTVTAQKVEENIQDVPISLTIFDEFEIEDRNIKSVKDIAQYTSSFTMFNPGDWGTVTPSIRGLYSDVTMLSSSVSMYIDGIPTLNTIGYDAVLENVERIEVLKGPQGTLYGKNAEAGVINIVTKKPTNKTRGNIGLEFGSDNKRAYTFNASGAIVKDKFYIGIVGKHYEKDGFMTNTFLGTEHNNRKSNYGKVDLRYTPTKNLEISLISSKSKRDDGALSVNKTTAINLKEVNNDVSDFAKLESIAHALKIDYNFGQYDLSSVTAYKKDHDLRFADYDYSPTKYYHSLMDVIYKNLSQEIKLSSQTDTLTWLAGIYADKSESTGGSTTYSINPIMDGGGLKNNAENNSLGFFTHANYKISDKLSILGGLRYDKDEKSSTNKKTNTKIDMSYSEISPKLAFNYKFDKDIMTYITVAKGYKSGGFYMFAPAGKQSYDKETLWNYEIGFKSKFLDNTLTFNTSLYYMDISDMQVLTAIDNIYGYISNAATATSKGFEFEANYKATDEIRLFSAFGYNKTTYDTFRDVGGDYKGNYASFSPKYNYSVGIQYRSGQGYYARVDVNAYGKMYIDKANKYEQKAYTLVNTKIGYEAKDYDIYLYAKNLFDKIHNIEGYYNGSYTYLSNPREIGVKFNYRF